MATRAALFPCILSLAGCAVVGAGGSSDGGGFTRAAQVRAEMLTCAEATRAAVLALRRLGYQTTDVVAATAEREGRVVGKQETGFAAATPEAGERHTAVVTIRCSDEGAEWHAITDAGVLRQLDFPSRFESALRTETRTERVQPRLAKARQKGLVWHVDPMRPGESSSALGVDVLAAGLTAVEIRLENRSSRTYRFRPGDVTLVATEGQRRQPLDATTVGSRLRTAGLSATPVLERRVSEAELRPGAIVEGYLFFEAAAYRRARVKVLDVDSGEPEGTSISF